MQISLYIIFSTIISGEMQGYFWILRLNLIYMSQALHKFLLHFPRDALPKCWFKLASYSSSLATPLTVTEIENKECISFPAGIIFCNFWEHKYVVYS